MPKVEVASGLTVHYQQRGEGPDVVFIHGLTGNLAIWHLTVVPWVCDRYRCLTYDLRGHGYTDVPPSGYTCAQFATDLIELLDALQIETADVVGHSLGADIALYCAFLYPDRIRRVVLLEALVPGLWVAPDPSTTQKSGETQSYTPPPEVVEWLTNLIDQVGTVGADYDITFEGLLKGFLSIPNQWGPLKGTPMSWSDDKVDRLLGTSIGEDLARVGELTLEGIERIKSPVHLVYDEDSDAWAGSFDKLKEHLPNVTFSLIRSEHTLKSHFLPLENPEAVIAEIDAALGAGN